MHHFPMQASGSVDLRRAEAELAMRGDKERVLAGRLGALASQYDGTLVTVRRRFGTRVFAVEVRSNISLAEAPAEGQSIFAYAPRSTGAECHRLLAGELLWHEARLARERGERLAAAGRDVR